MKTRKLISLAVLIMVLLASCASMQQEVKVDGISCFADITVDYKSISDDAAQNYLSANRFDKSKTAISKDIKAYNKKSYTTNKRMTKSLTKDLEELMLDLLENKGFKIASDDNKSRFNVEANITVRYGINEHGHTWFYDVYITALDKENAPLDHSLADLARLDRAVETTTRIETTEQHPEMSWSTHGEIYAADANEAEKILMDRLEKELRDSFINHFFIL